MENAALDAPSGGPLHTPADTTASYLLRRLCAEHGYRFGTVVEAQALSDAADVTLIRADGLTFELLLALDREQTERDGFALPLDVILAAGKACLTYTGKVHSTKMPVAIQVLEVGHGVPSGADQQRLRRITRRMPGLQKVSVQCFAVDVDTGRVWSSAGFTGFLRRRYLERLLRQPRQTDEQLLQPELAHLPASPPWATGALIAALLLGFSAELAWGLRPWSGLLRPALETLVAFGGLARPLVEQGEWQRLLTMAFLHADAVHLALNLVALGIGGMLLESLVGHLWLLGLFVLGALGGSALSLLWNAPDVVSVGASGAILALLTAAFAGSFRLPAGAPRTRIHLLVLQMLLPSLLPLAWHRGGESIDVASHLGGALMGALCGGLLLKTWRAAEPLPRFRGAALAAVLAGAVALAFGLASAPGARAESLRLASYANLLIPEVELPGSEQQLLDAAADLVARYPRDPRSYWFLGVRLAREGELSAAEAELRSALAETEILDNYFEDRQLEITLRSLLAMILLERGQPEEARGAAAPVCSAGEAGKVPEALQALDVCP